MSAQSQHYAPVERQLTSTAYKNPFCSTINVLDRLPEIRKIPVSASEYAYQQRLIDQLRVKMVDVFKNIHDQPAPATNLTFSAWL
jgi:hypothetical protein